MPNERVPINIFTGILPISYNFIDQCDDSSKWFNSTITPFTAITEDDISGYMGKGINFQLDESVSDNLVGAAAYRPLFLPPSNGVIFFGAVVRMNLSAMVNVVSDRYAYITVQSSNALTTRFHMGFRFRLTSSKSSLLSTVRVYSGTNESADYSVPGTIDDGAGPVGIPCWLRMVLRRNGYFITDFWLNNVYYPVSIPISYSWMENATNPATMVKYCEILQVKYIKTVKNANKADFDIDQIWLSDTENIV